jgi:chaperonin GroEL
MHLPYLLAGTVIREEVGLTLDKAGKEVLGTASKVVLTKDSTTIVGDGSTQEAVNKRVSQIKNQIEVSLSLLTNNNYFGV